MIDYRQALQQQEEILEVIAKTASPGTLIFCTHPPIVTKGRKTESGDIHSWTGDQIEVSRGGRATYHGPSQLLCYPLINLDKTKNSLPKRDVVWYLRSIEQSLIHSLGQIGLQAHGKTKSSNLASDLTDTGVWLAERKIASVGVGVRHWVTFHGAALNLDVSAEAFQGIRPCGYSPEVMTSVEEATGRKADRQGLQQIWCKELIRIFSNEV